MGRVTERERTERHYIFGKGRPIHGQTGSRMFVKGHEVVLQVEKRSRKGRPWKELEAKMPRTNLRQAVRRLGRLDLASYRGDGFKLEMRRSEDDSGLVELKLEPNTIASTPGRDALFFNFNTTVNLTQLSDI